MNKSVRLLGVIGLGVGLTVLLMQLFFWLPVSEKSSDCPNRNFIRQGDALCTEGVSLDPQTAVSASSASISSDALPELPEQPAEILQEAYRRVLDAQSYQFAAQSEQTLIPRPLPSMIGRSQQQVDMQIQGEVDLSGETYLSMSLDGPGLDPTPVALVQDRMNTYLLREGERIPIENPAGLASPTGDYLSYLAAAKNVLPCEETEAPFATAVSCFTYEIDSVTYAELVRQQMTEQLAQIAGAAALDLQISTSELIANSSGTGKVWLDANGLPLRQKIDLFMPEADQYYDVDVRMVIDYQFDEAAVAAVQAANVAQATYLPAVEQLVGQVETAVPHLLLLAVLSLVALLFILCRRRPWMYTLVAVLLILSLTMTPVLQIINVNLFMVHQAKAAADSLSFTEAFVLESDELGATAVSPNQSLMTESLNAAAMAFEPATYCGLGGNADRDQDGLADDAENCLGTNPNLADTDGDGIDDGVELLGFQYGSQTWYSDPLNSDTNLDGVGDLFEWSVESGGMAPNWDIDGDGIPNLYDTDDDGDGVSDKLDISPASYTEYLTKTDAIPTPPLLSTVPPLTNFSLFDRGIVIVDTSETSKGINITGQYDGYAYIDLQVQPSDLDHLRFGITPLDWGFDNKGQIQEHNEAQDEDIELIPMLMVETNVLPSEALVQGYHVTPYEDDDQDGYGELLIPLNRIGDGGRIEAFQARLAYGPDSLRSLSEDGINWRNLRIVWVVRGTLDKEAENGTRSQQTSLIHTYEEPAMRVTGWEVTKSSEFRSAIFGTPGMANDDRALFQMILGMSGSYLMDEQLTLSDIQARLSGANTPPAQKWGITTTVAVDLPLESYGHMDEGLADINNRIKDFLTNHYSFNTLNTVLVAYEFQSGSFNLDDLGKTVTDFSPSVNLSGVGMMTQRSMHLNMRDGWKSVSGGTMALKVAERLQPTISLARQDLLDQYPAITETELVALTQAMYATWEAGRSNIITLDGINTAANSVDEQDLYQQVYLTPRDRHNDPQNIRTLPGYLVEVGNFAQKGAGLIIDSDNIGQYIQANVRQSRLLGFSRSTAQYVEQANTTMVSTLGSETIFGDTLDWKKFQVEAGKIWYESDSYTVSRQRISDSLNSLSMVAAAVEAVHNHAQTASNIIKKDPTAVLGATQKLALKYSAKIAKLQKFMDVAGKVIGAVAMAVDIGMAVTMFVMAGDFSMKAIAMLIAQIVLAVMLFVLNFIPGGSIIAAVMALFDLILSLCEACSEFLGIGSISGWITQNLANYFYREAPLTEVQDYSYLGRNNALADEEMGFVVNNRYVITDTFEGVIKVSGTKGIDWNRVKDSAFLGAGTALFTLADQLDVIGRIFGGPSKKENLQNSWICGEFVVNETLTAIGSTCPDENADYKLDSIPGDADYWTYINPMQVTVLLDEPVHNFEIQLSTKVVAQTRWDASVPLPPIAGIPIGRVHWTKERKLNLPDDMDSETQSQWETTPIYIDVLPASIDGFWQWGQTESILTNPDPDGDGMLTKDEVNYFLGINSYTNLKNYFTPHLDTFGGGTFDRFLANWDYFEDTHFATLNGYCTTYPLHAHICDLNNSPPWLTADYDHDGLSDKFEYDNQGTLGTNPNQYDTDGDGLSDGFEYSIGTRIDKKDTDSDGLNDNEEIFHPGESGVWEGGWEVSVPEYGPVGPNGRSFMTVRVFSDPLLYDTDGDGLNDAAEKMNGTSPRAFNRVPRIYVDARPTAVSPQGVRAVYVRPGDAVTMTANIEVYPPYTVSSTMSLDIPFAAFSFPNSTHLNGTRWVDNTGVTWQARWNFSDNVLQPWEHLHGNTTGVAASISQSAAVTAVLTLPYGDEGHAQQDTALFVVDVEQPSFQWMTPINGELIGGGVTHYVVGGTTHDPTTWIESLTLNMPDGNVAITDTESFSPWAYTWELPTDGIYTLRGTATDFVGYTSPENAVEVMVDNTAPTVDVDLQEGQVYGPPQDSSVITITLSGTATENLSGLTRVQISTDGGPWREVWTLDSATVTNTTFTDFTSNFTDRAIHATWDAVWTLPNVETVQGYHNLRVRAFDQAGNWPVYLERNIIIDVLPPTDELVNRAYLYEFPHVVANEPHTFDGVANDVGNVPAPSRPVELVGDLDSMEDATILLGMDNIHENDGGVQVAWVGDFNGDRRGDLVVGLPAAEGGNGRVSIIYGRSGNWPVPDQQALLAGADSSFIGLDSAGIGEHIMPAGDVNGDGFADLLIGDPANNRVFLIYGRPVSLGSKTLLDGPQSANWTVLIPPTGQQIGATLGAAGDVNGDGFADFLVGATGSTDVAYLMLGQSTNWYPSTPIHIMAASRIQQGGNATLTALGDLDGDFLDEFAIGVDNTLYLFSGKSSYAPQASTYTYLTSAVDTFNSADATPQAVGLGDVNGDHFDDFIYTDGSNQILTYGDASLTDNSWGTHTYSYGAGFVAAPGDVDNDGLNDILIGNGTDAFLIAGSNIGSSQSTIAGVAKAGSTHYPAGADLNSDGSSDLLLVPTTTDSQASAVAAETIADLPPTWVPTLPEQSLDTFTGDTTWSATIENAFVNADGYCHGLSPCYTTIQAAINAYTGAAHIKIQPGVYAPFVIDGNRSGLILQGTDPDAVIIDGNGGQYGIQVSSVQGVLLENMTVRNATYGVQLESAGVGGHELYGVRTILRSMLIYDTAAHDIFMSRDSTVSVVDSTLARGINHVGAAGTADSSIAGEWSSVANTPWPIYDGGDAVIVENVVYTSRGGGSNEFGRYYVIDNSWVAPWGPANTYEDNSVMAAGSDDQVYLLGAPHWKEAGFSAGNGWRAQFAFAPDGNTYAIEASASPVKRWSGAGWDTIPGSPSFCQLIATHPTNSDLYCLTFNGDSLEKWDGSSWTTVTTENLAASSTHEHEMVVDNNGMVHVVGNMGFECNYATLNGTIWACGNAPDGATTIALLGSTPIIGGDFSTEFYQNIASSVMPGVTGPVYDIEVGEDGAIYVAGHFTSTLNFSGNIDQAAPSGIAMWKDSQWTVFPSVTPAAGVGTGYSSNIVWPSSIAETAGGELYAAGLWISYAEGGGQDVRETFVRWNGSSWERAGQVKNGSNNEVATNVAATGDGVFISGDFDWIEFSDGSTLNTTDIGLIEFSHEVYSTTANSWTSNLIGAPMSLRDGASYAGDGEGNLILLVGGGRPDSFKYDIESGRWSAVDSMPHPVNASAMTLGEDGYVYAVTDGSSTFYRFDGYGWLAEGPAISGATIDDGVALTYDAQFGTYYLLPGGNGSKLFRYNPAWGGGWEELPADRYTPAGVRPGAALVFARGTDENYLFTAQGNYDGDTSVAFWRYSMPMPNKIDFTDTVIYGQNPSSWLNLSDPLPEDFNFRVDENSRFFGGTGWTPTNMGALPTTTADPFLDAARDLYRMDDPAFTIGYHHYVAPVTATTTTGIQAMINTGASRVVVEPGIYEEDIYLVNGVELVGTNPDWTIIRPLTNSTADALVRAEGVNGASMSRFTLDGQNSGLDGFAAIGNAQNLTLERVRIFDTDTAVSLNGTQTDLELVHATIAQNSNGLTATGCASIDVRNTIFAFHTGVGLSHEACADIKLHTYNLYWSNAADFGDAADAGAAELFLDPNFVDPMDHDYRTLNFSPVIDAGNPTDPAPPGAGSRADIGYIEQGRVNFYVDDSYCPVCLNDGLTWQVDAFDTIQDALNAAEHALSSLNPSRTDPPRLVVGVAPGTYAEHISIPSHVLLYGSGAEMTIIDGQGSGTAVSFDGVTHAGLYHFSIINADTGIALTNAANLIDIQRNIIRTNTIGVSVSGRATGQMEFNTLVANQTGLSITEPGSWLAIMHNIFTGSTTGAIVTNSGQLYTDYNLFNNTTNFSGVTAGENDLLGQNPLFAGGTTPYRLTESSPALDAAAGEADVPEGGGIRADLGYSELLAAPVLLLLGQEDLSTVMGNSGVASVEYGIIPAPDVTAPVTSTLPASWMTVTLNTPGETLSYWSFDYTPVDEGLYHFYSRATDMVGNQEKDVLDWYDGSFVVDSTPPVVEWINPPNGASLQTPLELRAQVTDYAAGAFSVDQNDVYFELDGQRFAAKWAAEPWDESAGEPRIFRAWIDVPVGSYTAVIAGAEDKAGNTAVSDSHTLTITGAAPTDTTPPTATVSLPLPNSWITHTIVFSGTVSDVGSGVASVELSLDGGATWQPTTVDGNSWSLEWDGPEGLPAISYPAMIRATDRAGWQTAVSFQFTIDEVAPTGMTPITFNYPEGTHFDEAPNLLIDWQPPIDASGEIYTLLVVDTISDTIPTEIVSGTSAIAPLNSSGDWYVHLGAVDAAGNMVAYHFGPWHVGLTDGAFGTRVQSIIIDGTVDEAANEWRFESEFLDDDERTFGSEVTFSPGGQQAFLTTWDANHTYMAWRGAHWELDGDLWIYMKTGGEGSNQLIVPLAAAPDATLPFAATYAVQITDAVSGTLYEYSNGWQPSALEWQFAQGGYGDTEIQLPLFSTDNVETIAFGLGDDHQVWAIFPTTNPLNPALAAPAQSLGFDRPASSPSSSSWVGYVWPDVTAVTNVSENQPTAVALAVDIQSPQAPLANWGPGSQLVYQIEIVNAETEVITGQPISITASPDLLLHNSIVGATCSQMAPWSCTLDALQPGSNLITLTTTLANDLNDAEQVTLQATLSGDNLLPEARNEASLTHQLDGDPPEVTVTALPFVKLGSNQFEGMATDGTGVGVAYVEVKPQFGSWQQVEGTEMWTVDLTVTPFAKHGDTWRFEVRAADLHGQISAPQLVTFTVDLLGPAVTLNAPSQISGTLYEVVGTIEDVPSSSKAVGVTVQIDNGEWREALLMPPDEESGEQTFVWTWHLPTTDGSLHSVNVETIDAVGNTGSLFPFQSIWVDNVSPVITVTNVLTEVAVQHYQAGAQTGDPVLMGTVTDGTAVSAVNIWVQTPSGSTYLAAADLTDETWQFTPALSSMGEYKLQVRAVDSLGNQAQTAFYLLNVMAAPNSGPNSFSTLEDTPLTFTPLLNDIDIDSDSIFVSDVGVPAHGTAVISAPDSIIFTPTLNFNGTDTFTYEASDGQFTDTATVTITVVPVNDPPVINGSELVTATMSEDGDPILFEFTGTNVDTDTWSWSVPDSTRATIDGTSGVGNLNASVTYAPPANFNGNDTFTVRVSDGQYSDEVTVAVTVTAVDDAPVATNDYLVLVPSEASQPITLNVLANDDEYDGQTLLLDAIGVPSGGSRAAIVGNQLVYTPTLSVGETETIAYTVSDGALTDTAVLHITLAEGDLTAKAGQTVQLDNAGTNGTIQLLLTVPTVPGAPDESVTVVIQETAVGHDAPNSFQFAGISFVLNAYVDGVKVSPFTLAHPVTLTLTYSEADVEHISRGDAELMLAYWTGNDWSSDGISLVSHDKVQNRITFTVAHFTQFALFGKDSLNLYLPFLPGS